MSKIVSFTGTIKRTVYDSDRFAVYAVAVPDDVITQNHMKKSKYGDITVSGNISGLSDGSIYDFTCEEQQTKHGYSYDAKKCVGSSDETSETNNIVMFLTTILTENQAFELLKAYPNIVELIMQGKTDEVDLSKLHGIGEPTFERIKNKVIENFGNMELLSFFGGAVSLRVIEQIRETYPSIESVKKLFKKEPYEFLMEFQRVSFITADKYLLQMQKEQDVFHCDLKTSEQRCLAYIKFKLKSIAEDEGSSKYSLKALNDNVDTNVPSCAQHFLNCIKNKAIWYDAENDEVALAYLRDIEKENAEAIRDALQYPIVWDIDVEQYRNAGDVRLTDEQIESLKILASNNVSVMNGPAGCVDCDTEFFTGTEWKRIADYQEGDMVLQYNEDGNANLVSPERYIKRRSDMLYHFETKYGLDQTLSLEHNVYYITSKGNLYHKTFKEVMENHLNTGFSGKFITTFNYSGPGISLNEYEIRLMVAIFADAHFEKRALDEKSLSYKRARFILKKYRKKDRLELLLKVLNIDFRKREMNGTKIGYTEYIFEAPFASKHFPKEWYACSKRQMEIIADEVVRWDGNFREHNYYTTTSKEDADFIQFVFTSIGRRGSISTADRRGRTRNIAGKEYETKSIDYIVSFTKRTLISMTADKRSNHTNTPITEYRPIDGYEYCFTVPSGILVLRRNDKIFITGNCGKSQTVSAVVKMLEDNKKTYALMTPTARSAKVVASYTNRPASTIHRGYGYTPSKGWAINKNQKLGVDVLIIDEASMLGAILFKHVLDGLDLKRTKLLLVGDSAQLSSIEVGNVLYDLINSGAVPVTSLTKIFRYDEGGISKIATDIRNRRPYIPANAAQHKTLLYGKEKDYSFTTSSDDQIVSDIAKIYSKMIQAGRDIRTVQIITAYNKGCTGSQAINKVIQKIANKENYGKGKCIKFGENVYYKGDFVIQKKNNYQTEVYDFDNHRCTGETDLVCNGDIGEIVEIQDEHHAVIKFDDKYFYYERAEFVDIKLGYAISVHSSQGSQSDTVIFATPRNQTFMMSSNLLYVGCTRSKKRCIQIGDPEMVRKAVYKKDEQKRNTFLCDFLSPNRDK